MKDQKEYCEVCGKELTAEMEIVAVPQTEFQIVESLDPNEDRGENGWGSSNKDKQHEQKESA